MLTRSPQPQLAPASKRGRGRGKEGEGKECGGGIDSDSSESMLKEGEKSSWTGEDCKKHWQMEIKKEDFPDRKKNYCLKDKSSEEYGSEKDKKDTLECDFFDKVKETWKDGKTNIEKTPKEDYEVSCCLIGH